MPKTLVVVEDSQFAQAILSKLKKHGFNIVFAEDAESGHIQILHRWKTSRI